MVTPEEAYGLKLASDVFVKGDHAYFTLDWIENDEYATSIYRFDGSDMERVTFGNHEKNPQFHNNSLYYIAYDKENERIMRIDPLKEPVKVYTAGSISKFVFHGDQLIAIASEKGDSKAPFVTDRIKYRYNARGLLRNKNKLILVQEKPDVLVEGDFDVTDVASNGSRIIFSATKEDDDRELGNIYDLNIAEKTFNRITDGSGQVSAICVSDEGTVAYVGNRAGTASWAISRLIFPEQDKMVEIGKNAASDVSMGTFVDGVQRLLYDHGKFYLVGQEGGTTSVYSYSDTVKKLTPERMIVVDFHVNNGKLAYLYTTPEKPSLLQFNGEMDFNPDISGMTPERIEKDGVEGWALVSGKENPTILSVHGGPHSAYGYGYSVEFNFLAKNGFNVVYTNPRGSSGYGEDYAKQCVNDWGGKDFEDILSILDAVVSKHSLSSITAITGGSYGGFMTNVAITKTDRFSSAISERCVSNLQSMCGTSDIGFWFNADEMGVSDPWDQDGMRRLIEASPVSYAKNVKTPTMFIHGEEDFRCPIEQSEQMYTALRMNGVPSMLVRYQGDNHEHARRGVPKNMKDRLQRKLDWFKKYCS